MSLTNKELIQRFLMLLILIGSWMLLIVRYAKSLPDLFIPHSFDDVRKIQGILRHAQQLELFILFCLIFLFKQTFGIPGALLLNILAGTMYGMLALPLICTLAAIGSSLMYYISKHLLGHVVFGTIVPKQTVTGMKARVDEHRDQLFLFMILIRTIPVIPGWLINLSSPFIGVPLSIFALATWLGSIPYVFVCLQASQTLSTIHSLRDVFGFWVIAKIVLLLLIILIPVVFKDKIMNSFSKNYRAIPDSIV